jgi:NADH-quinone oxidoreductase subunit H
MNMFLPEDWVFIGSTILKVALMVGVMLGIVSYAVHAERRVSALMQDRLGPNRTGIPFTNIKLWGLGQPIADALKLMLKEQFTPANVNKVYYYLAPVLAMMPSLIVVCVIPFGSFIDLRPLAAWIGEPYGWTDIFVESFKIPAVVANLDVGVLFTFAILSISVYGIVLAGWSSNSRYPFLGGIRSSAQMISYELSMGLSVVPIFMVIGQLNLTQIVSYQVQHGWLALPFWPLHVKSLILGIPFVISFIIFLIAAFAETNRLPFDIPEAEQELVGGYHTEYASMKFGLFFLGEYAAIIAASALIVTLFLGGWSLPLPWFNSYAIPSYWPIMAGWNMPWWFGFVHILVFIAKIVFFIFFFIWVRWTLPRFRYDQLMDLGWKVFIPLGFANVFLTAIILALMKA